jgi:CheY-like chemotaxis protein
MNQSASRARALASATMLLAAPSATPSRAPWGADRRATDAAPRDAGASGSESTRPHASATEAPVWRGRVLIADDEQRIRLALRTCLEAEGYEVYEARDGREAVDAVVRGAPDVLLLDLAMPVLDGLSALRELAASGKNARPRVIVLTAYGSVSAAQMAHELGVIAFLEKPVMPEALRAAVAMALR